MLRSCLAFALVLLSLPAQADGPHVCAAALGDLHALAGDGRFPLLWEETTMGDGKPLVVSISESGGRLVLRFDKSREGLWAEGAGLICKTREGMEARFAADQLRLGPAANWVMRAVLRRGGNFTLTPLDAGRLRIATAGWSGTFAASR